MNYYQYSDMQRRSWHASKVKYDKFIFFSCNSYLYIFPLLLLDYFNHRSPPLPGRWPNPSTTLLMALKVLSVLTLKTHLETMASFSGGVVLDGVCSCALCLLRLSVYFSVAACHCVA